jgi:K+-sensing histidine kinase KdpD
MNEVWDKGKGISEIHKDMVFERMYTMEDSINKRSLITIIEI